MRGLMAVMVMAICAAGGAQAMGNRLPDREERPGWERPGDVIAREGTAAPEAGPDADLPQIFFGPEGEPADWHWKARVVVVFADTPQNPSFTRQMRELEAGAAQLVERDAVVVTDTDPAAASAWRRALRPGEFALILIEKDGTVILRKPGPRDMREITHTIDRSPLRRQELGRSSVMP